MPNALGGGIRSLNDIEKCLKVGADKVSLNSSITENPKFLKEAVRFLPGTIVVNIEAKQTSDSVWKFTSIMEEKKLVMKLMNG